MSMNDYFRLKRRSGHNHAVKPLKHVESFFSDTEDENGQQHGQSEDFSFTFSRFLEENDESLL